MILMALISGFSIWLVNMIWEIPLISENGFRIFAFIIRNHHPAHNQPNVVLSGKH
jgi:hypothetical protein